MFRIVLGHVFSGFRYLAVAMLLMGIHVKAQNSCTRLHLSFEASENTELDGKISVGWEQTGGGKYGFTDFWLDEETVSADRVLQIGAFNVVGVDSFRTFLNDNELDIDGDGDFEIKRTDCATSLPSDDGRLNIDDPASLAVVYANSKTGGFDVYLVNATTGGGDLVIRATRAQIDAARAAATAPGGVNTLIQASGPASLWALTSGECQRNAFYLDGKPDVFIFPCAAS
jgi:hypothetical protein